MHTRLDANELSVLVDELLMLFEETAQFQAAQSDVKEVLCEASKTVGNLRLRLRRARGRYVVAVVGLTNVGKSTLLNALFGEDLAPKRNGPCTSAPIEFVFGPTTRVVAYLHKDVNRPAWECDNVEAIHRCLEELASETNKAMGRLIKKVSVELPHKLLTDGLVIADTPGFGAALRADEDSYHDEAVKQYLAREAAQAFWIVLADQGIGKAEKSFHDRFFAGICDDIVVTGSENWDHPDRERFRRRFMQTFAQRMPRFHFVSGLLGFEARKIADAHALEAAGITLLEKRVRELTSPSGRHKSVENDLKQLAEDVGHWLDEFRDTRDQPLRHKWRGDSWYRWMTMTPESDLKQDLTKAMSGLEYNEI